MTGWPSNRDAPARSAPPTVVEPTPRAGRGLRARFRLTIAGYGFLLPALLLPLTSQMAPVLYMSKSTPARQQAAWDFIKWVTQKEQMLRRATSTGYLPIRKSAAAGPAFNDFLSKKPRFNAVMDRLSSARSEPTLAAWSETGITMGNAENNVTTLTTTPRAASEVLLARANTALKR